MEQLVYFLQSINSVRHPGNKNQLHQCWITIKFWPTFYFLNQNPNEFLTSFLDKVLLWFLYSSFRVVFLNNVLTSTDYIYFPISSKHSIVYAGSMAVSHNILKKIGKDDFYLQVLSLKTSCCKNQQFYLKLQTTSQQSLFWESEELRRLVHCWRGKHYLSSFQSLS